MLTADYTGVAGWKNLESAVEEAGEVAALFTPPATEVAPELVTVIDLFDSRPEYDVVHAALHGKYDAQGGQEGIVLLKKSPAGGAVAQFLTPTMLEAGSLPHGPFVFLNACQVASRRDRARRLRRVRLDAAAHRRRRRSSPRCGTSRTTSPTPSRAPSTPPLSVPTPVSAAEAMRAVRATYTEDGARAEDPQQHATLIAYQVFGHPRLHLTKPNEPP